MCGLGGGGGAVRRGRGNGCGGDLLDALSAESGCIGVRVGGQGEHARAGGAGCTCSVAFCT